MKREADNVAFRMKYYGDDAKSHLFALLNTIGDLKDEWEMHDECLDSATHEHLLNKIQNLEELLTEAIPYIEAQLDDDVYKPNVIKQLIKKIKEAV